MSRLKSSAWCMAPSCPEIPEISQLSWNSWNFTVVLKFLKFHSCPEIVLNQQLSWNFTHLVRMSSYGPLLCCRYTFYKSWLYVYVADVECQVMFSLVTLYCFMFNIALVTFLGLQYWSASMINIYEHRKTCIFCVLSLVKPTKVSWNFLKIWSWNLTFCCWEPWIDVTCPNPRSWDL